MTTKILIPADPTLIDLMNLVLAEPQGDPALSRDPVIETFTADLGDGFEIDIKIVNGGDYTSPYVNAMLFHYGHEMECLNPVAERLDSEFTFMVSGSNFTVQIVPEENVI